MRSYYLLLSFSLIVLIGLASCLNRKDSAYIDELRQYQSEMNKKFADHEKSPLTDVDREAFASLNFFPIDESFKVVAKLSKTLNNREFEMKTTTDRLPVYKQYGTLSFSFNKKAYQLNVYQNVELISKEGYEDYLFLPFTDITNGNESYSGGRYIDLRIPLSDTLIIDFNKAYNPYCAYNHKYSCPIPPSENDLNIEIRAGVKSYAKH